MSAPHLNGGPACRGVLFGLVHPLLDVSAVVNLAYLERYGLEADNGILAEQNHQPIYDELMNGCQYKVSVSPGGATQNAIRVAQYFLKDHHATSVVGCIGADKIGTQMSALLVAEGVRIEFQVDESAITGCCAVLVTSRHDRSLVTRLDAANKYTIEHLVSPAVWQMVQLAKYFYISGFMLNKSSDSVKKLGEHAAEENKCFVMNLSAPYVSAVFKESLQECLEYCDIVVGNSDEARALVDNFGLPDCGSLHEIVRRISELPKRNKKRNRIVIITQQADPVVVFREDQVEEYPVIPISGSTLVDTNGAGDAFVGGFLAHFVQDQDFTLCMDQGLSAAHMILQVQGCRLPGQEK